MSLARGWDVSVDIPFPCHAVTPSCFAEQKRAALHTCRCPNTAVGAEKAFPVLYVPCVADGRL